jgi:hypothetical protein
MSIPTLGRRETEGHIYTPIITHKILEEKIFDAFKQSPDYSIKNINGYRNGELALNLFNPYDPNNALARIRRLKNESLYVVNCDNLDKLTTVLIIISAVIAMVIFYRSYTLNAKQIYVFNTTEADADDSVTQGYVFKNPEDYDDIKKVEQLKAYNSLSDSVQQMYVFKNDSDAKDPAKVAQLKAYNEIHNPDKVAQLKAYNNSWSTLGWTMGRSVLVAIPAAITAWQIYKRTSVHRPGFDEDIRVKPKKSAWISVINKARGRVAVNNRDVND